MLRCISLFVFMNAAIGIGGAQESVGGSTMESRGDQDQVIFDDLIVRGSACIGDDCLDGEGFIFTTLKLKENNIRIEVEDTSSTNNFPTTDWAIVFNESSDGGKDGMFFVNLDTGFTILELEPGGIVRANEFSADEFNSGLFRTGGNGDFMGGNFTGFNFTGTSGTFTTLGIAGGAVIQGGLVVEGGLTVDDGDVGIGTANPGAKMHILTGGTAASGFPGTTLLLQNDASPNAGAILTIMGGTASTSQLSFGDTANQFIGRMLYQHADDTLDFQTNGTTNMTLNNSTDTNLLEMSNGAVLTAGGTWMNASSRAYKENIQPLSVEAATAAFKGLDPVTFNYKLSPDEQYVGFIAEDVPELVAVADRRGLSPMDVVAVLTLVVQEQQKVISEHTELYAKIESRLIDLEVSKKPARWQ